MTGLSTTQIVELQSSYSRSMPLGLQRGDLLDDTPRTMTQGHAIKVEVGARLRIARLAVQAAHNITHREFCETCRLGASTLSSYETGACWPSPLLLMRLKRVYGITSDYVYTESLEGLPTIIRKEIAKLCRA